MNHSERKGVYRLQAHHVLQCDLQAPASTTTDCLGDARQESVYKAFVGWSSHDIPEMDPTQLTSAFSGVFFSVCTHNNIILLSSHKKDFNIFGLANNEDYKFFSATRHNFIPLEGDYADCVDSLGIFPSSFDNIHQTNKASVARHKSRTVSKTSNFHSGIYKMSWNFRLVVYQISVNCLLPSKIK